MFIRTTSVYENTGTNTFNEENKLITSKNNKGERSKRRTKGCNKHISRITKLTQRENIHKLMGRKKKEKPNYGKNAGKRISKMDDTRLIKRARENKLFTSNRKI